MADGEVPGLIPAIRAGLAARADPARAAGQQRYMRSAMPFRGVRVPDVRRLVADLCQGVGFVDATAWQSTVRELWDTAEFREEWYAAVALARQRRYAQWATALDALPLWEHLIRTGGWWDVCDEITEHLVGPTLIAHPDRITPILRTWSTDDDRWIRRAAILAQNRRRAGTDVALLADGIAGSLSDPDFFSRKAIGWALREYSKTNPRWVEDYVTENAARLSALSKREALRLIR